MRKGILVKKERGKRIRNKMWKKIREISDRWTKVDGESGTREDVRGRV